MNIVYSCDSHFFNLFFISVVSLFETNKDVRTIRVYLLGKEISSENRKRTETLMSKYGRQIIFIDMEMYGSRLRFWEKEEDSRYARLLLGEIIKADKVIYLDCDTMICRSLENLWETDISGYYGGAVLDTVRKNARDEAGIQKGGAYYNSGVLLLNLKEWREDDVLSLFRQYKQRITKGIYRDQRVINACISEKILTLHPRYNLLPEMLDCKASLIRFLTGTKRFYSDEELTDARENPVVVHFAGKSIDRPWYGNCEHPYKDKYRMYVKQNETLLQPELCSDTRSNCLKWKLRKKLRYPYALFSRMKNNC